MEREISPAPKCLGSQHPSLMSNNILPTYPYFDLNLPAIKSEHSLIASVAFQEQQKMSDSEKVHHSSLNVRNKRLSTSQFSRGRHRMSLSSDLSIRSNLSLGTSSVNSKHVKYNKLEQAQRVLRAHSGVKQQMEKKKKLLKIQTIKTLDDIPSNVQKISQRFQRAIQRVFIQYINVYVCTYTVCVCTDE